MITVSESMIGTYSAEGASSCIQCEAGFYCDQGTSDTQKILNQCPQGHYCILGTQYDHQYPCPKGTYSSATGLESENACQPCDDFSYCEYPV